MAKFTTLMRVKVDATTRHPAGVVIDLGEDAALPLLRAGAVEAVKAASEKPDQAPAPEAEQPKAKARAKAAKPAKA